MVVNDKEKKACTTLLAILIEIYDLLEAAGEDLSRYGGLDKIKNIAKNCDPSGFKKIPDYLDGIVSVMRDNKLSRGVLENKIGQAYVLSTQLQRPSLE